MEKFLKLFLTATAIATAVMVSSEPAFARGGAAHIMNSPGYQRRLQESRQLSYRPTYSRLLSSEANGDIGITTKLRCRRDEGLH